MIRESSIGRRPSSSFGASHLRRTSRSLKILLGIVVASLWQWFGSVNPHLMASFFLVLSDGWHMVLGVKIWSSLGITVMDMLIGFFAACIVGIPLGAVMALNRVTNRIADMYLNWMLSVPELAFIPFFVILFGLGGLTRLVIVFVFALPVVVQNTRLGVDGVSRSLVEMGQVFEATPQQMTRKILLPNALPMIMAGARMGLARSLLGIVAAGFFVKQVGLGGLIFQYQNDFALGKMFVGVLVVVLLGLGLAAIMEVLDARLTRWNRSVGSAR